ncbi:MAG: ArsR family transcriptional regulator [Promethearchaeota archaeon]|nr:MAG: ArsR family transcriptional regulator [Candidatus Lokiarchaeota archaeon]
MSDNQLQLDKKKLLADDINFRITSLLIVYNELSLSELTDKVRGSKSTSHRHLAVLLENGLVEVSREIKVRSDRKAKYYRLTERAYESLGFSANDTLEERHQATINFFLYYKTFIDEFLEYLLKGEKKDQLDRFQNMSDNDTFEYWATLLTEDEYKDLKGEFDRVYQKIVEKQAKGKREQLRPYFFMLNFIPFKKMLDEKNPEQNPKD